MMVSEDHDPFSADDWDTEIPGITGKRRGYCEKKVHCPVCIEDIITEYVEFPCGHICCRLCYLQGILLKRKTISGRDEKGCKCPSCRKVFGIFVGDNNIIGTCHTTYKGNFITITFTINGGRTNEGRQYLGTTRIAYLPNTPEGQQIAKMVEVAFDRKLCFHLSESLTTHQFGICWTSIPFKTSQTGGSANHGYPDNTYLDRLRGKLNAHGIY